MPKSALSSEGLQIEWWPVDRPVPYEAKLTVRTISSDPDRDVREFAHAFLGGDNRAVLTYVPKEEA